MEVKNRMCDLFQQVDHPDESEAYDLPPTHDPALIFRSVESKLNAADPHYYLQGVWVLTYLKQEVRELEDAFNKLDPTKVHFAVLGDFEAGEHLLTRNPDHSRFLTDLFGLTETERFTFRRGSIIG